MGLTAALTLTTLNHDSASVHSESLAANWTRFTRGGRLLVLRERGTVDDAVSSWGRFLREPFLAALSHAHNPSCLHFLEGGNLLCYPQS